MAVGHEMIRLKRWVKESRLHHYRECSVADASRLLEGLFGSNSSLCSPEYLITCSVRGVVESRPEAHPHLEKPHVHNDSNLA